VSQSQSQPAPIRRFLGTHGPLWPASSRGLGLKKTKGAEIYGDGIRLYGWRYELETEVCASGLNVAATVASILVGVVVCDYMDTRVSNVAIGAVGAWLGSTWLSQRLLDRMLLGDQQYTVFVPAGRLRKIRYGRRAVDIWIAGQTQAHASITLARQAWTDSECAKRFAAVGSVKIDMSDDAALPPTGYRAAT
jgi:hypothetical protein